MRVAEDKRTEFERDHRVDVHPGAEVVVIVRRVRVTVRIAEFEAEGSLCVIQERKDVVWFRATPAVHIITQRDIDALSSFQKSKDDQC